MLSISPRQAAGTPDPAAAKTPGGPADGSPQPADSTENRAAHRHPASALPAITGLRIKPHGVEAVLINISESGLLAECSERLKPGTAVTAAFEGTFVPSSMEGRVARTAVSSMGKDGRLRYHVGIAFSKPCPLGVEPPAKVEAAATVEAATVEAPAKAGTPATAEPAARAEAPAATVATPQVSASVGASAALEAAAAASATLDDEIEIEIEIPLPAASAEVVVRNRW